MVKSSLVQYKFNNAAKRYLSNATMQKISAQVLNGYLDKYATTNSIIVDLGSGVGTLQHRDDDRYHENCICYDISLNMLKNAPYENRVNGNAYNLPFANESVDIVISNLMIQWVDDKNQVIAEIKRILKPKGYLILTTLIQPSLYELNDAWSEVDDLVHSISFVDHMTYKLLFANLDAWQVYIDHSWSQTFYFSDGYSLMRHFKSTGTSLPRTNVDSGLGGRRSLHKFIEAYEKLRTTSGLPLTYNYLLLAVQKV